MLPGPGRLQPGGQSDDGPDPALAQQVVTGCVVLQRVGEQRRRGEDDRALGRVHLDLEAVDRLP